ncbi:hypothetical protein ALQ75_05434 [Pseudomonas savastanoi pv. glycinea]|nr:hypothetical protein ALQ75_05434 [Pseudomonas savastanoi pv. glycinea]
MPPQNAAGQGEPDFQVIDLPNRFPRVAWQRLARRFGIQQQAAVRMLRRFEQRLAIGLLDNLAGTHDADALRHAMNQIEIMTDQQQRHVQALLQLLEQQEDLALHGDVQRSGRFVGNQQFRLARQRHGNHHPLALASGQFVRVGFQAFFRLLNADHFQQFDNAFLRFTATDAAMQQQRLAYLSGHAVQRVQRGHRFLENHGNAVATQLAQGALVGTHQLLTPVGDAASGQRTVVRQQLQDRVRSDGLARAGFTHQRQAFTAAYVQAQVADDLLPAERNAQVANFDQVFRHIRTSGQRHHAAPRL